MWGTTGCSRVAEDLSSMQLAKGPVYMLVFKRKIKSGLQVGYVLVTILEQKLSCL